MDFIVGFAPVSTHKTFLWVDIVFGPVSAVVTFCGALLIMDGQLHPILLFGIFLGMAISHFSIGRFLCGAVRKMRISARRGARCMGTFLCRRAAGLVCRTKNACAKGLINRKKMKNS